jgi:hypothetical protein
MFSTPELMSRHAGFTPAATDGIFYVIEVDAEALPAGKGRGFSLRSPTRPTPSSPRPSLS